MPRLSDTMTEGTVATWLKKVGDTINFDFVTYSVRKVSTSVKLGDTIILTVNKLDKAI